MKVPVIEVAVKSKSDEGLAHVCCAGTAESAAAGEAMMEVAVTRRAAKNKGGREAVFLTEGSSEIMRCISIPRFGRSYVLGKGINLCVLSSHVVPVYRGFVFHFLVSVSKIPSLEFRVLL
jgi:hypothetical protein